MVEYELRLFAIYFLTGIAISILFDFFRSIRKTTKNTNISIYIEDILFWIISFTIILIVMFKFNNLQIRGYLIIAFLLGGVSYYITISKYVVNVNVKILNILKRVVKFINKFFLKLIGRPILFIFINCKKFIKKFENQKIKRNNVKWNIYYKKLLTNINVYVKIPNMLGEKSNE